MSIHSTTNRTRPARRRTPRRPKVVNTWTIRIPTLDAMFVFTTLEHADGTYTHQLPPNAPVDLQDGMRAWAEDLIREEKAYQQMRAFRDTYKDYFAPEVA